MLFSEFSKYLKRLDNVSSRIEITKILSELFKGIKDSEAREAVYLLLGGLAPRHENIVFNIADKIMERILSEAYKQDLQKISSLYKKSGDLGNTAESLVYETQYVKYSIKQIYDELLDIAKDSGEKSQDRKIDKSAILLKSLDSLSAKYVVRIMLGKLRLGFSDSTVLDAISWMERGDKSAKKKLEKAYFVLPDVGFILKNVKEKGIKKATEDISPVVGIPVLPVLAQRIKSPIEMIKKMGEVFVEPKLDGLRLSLHIDKDKKIIKAYTRNLNENSWMFPELQNIEEYIKAKSVILDTEAVGLSDKSKKMANFQITMTRRRKYDIEDVSQKTKITFFVFDILNKNGKSLLNKPFFERRKILEETIVDSPMIKKVESLKTRNPEIISKMYKKYSKDGFEGVMVKKVGSCYVPGRTGWRWVKMKQGEDSLAKVSDTIDALIMGYSVGRGKRAGFGVGKFLVGIKDKDRIVTITKVGTGLTDEQFKNLNSKLINLKISQKPKEYVVEKTQYPDHWVEPSLVVEIAADEITKSPSHSAGFGLRFPRLVDFRVDKNKDQITTLVEFKDLFKLQNK